jgi:hypothetical protein
MAVATDIFNRDTNAYGGSFSADSVFVSFPVGLGGTITGLGAVGLLLQNLNMGYRQNIVRLYEIGSAFHFLVAGRTQGQFGAQRVLGPRPISLAFYAKFGDVCQAATNIIDLILATGCDPNAGPVSNQVDYQPRYCVIDQLGVTMQAQDAIVNESINMMFCSLLATAT